MNLASRSVARLLVVDDEPMTLSVVSELLRNRGYFVQSAHSVSEALKVPSNSFDLLITDLELHDGTGYEVFESFRKKGQNKAIVLSGNGMPEDILKSKENEFSAHLTKPIDMRSLDSVIQKVLAGEKTHNML